jgi:hypothetical protein
MDGMGWETWDITELSEHRIMEWNSIGYAKQCLGVFVKYIKKGNKKKI